MIYTLRFLPELEEDVFGGYAWYEGKSPGLAINPADFGRTSSLKKVAMRPGSFKPEEVLV